MSEQKAYSPARFWRLNKVYRSLNLEKCNHCGNGHFLPRLRCLNENLNSQSIPIEQDHGKIFEAAIDEGRVTS